MTNVVNLRSARKRAARDKAERTAAENRTKHGVSKADRTRTAADLERNQKNLDQHMIDNGDRG